MTRLGTRWIWPSVRNLSTQIAGETSAWYASSEGLRAASPSATHMVTNQATALSDYNAFTCDQPLLEGVGHGSAEWAASHLSSLAAQTGSASWQTIAQEANRNPPQLISHDRFGNRIDRAHYHPAYHQLMRLALENGAAGFAWGEHQGRPGAHTARATLMYLMYQLECGVCCPVTMTFAAVPALAAAPSIGEEWVGRLAAPGYDERDVPVTEKSAATMGMSMTEKQGGALAPSPHCTQASAHSPVQSTAACGVCQHDRRAQTSAGSDVRSNTTVATPVSAALAGEGHEFTLRGHKWFTSAPMSDAFLTLAQTTDGVSCFLVPRWLPDGSRNAGFTVQRLKEKLGDR